MSMYWGNTGEYQTLYDTIMKKIPTTGNASDPRFEMMRCISNLGYEYYNNGNYNWMPDGSHDQYLTYLNEKINEYYDIHHVTSSIEKISDALVTIKKLGSGILEGDEYYLATENTEDAFDVVVNVIIEIIISDSTLLTAILAETFVIRDPANKTEEAYRLVYQGCPQSPSFNSKGAALAYSDMLNRGERKPDTIINNKENVS